MARMRYCTGNRHACTFYPIRRWVTVSRTNFHLCFSLGPLVVLEFANSIREVRETERKRNRIYNIERSGAGTEKKKTRKLPSIGLTLYPITRRTRKEEHREKKRGHGREMKKKKKLRGRDVSMVCFTSCCGAPMVRVRPYQRCRVRSCTRIHIYVGTAGIEMPPPSRRISLRDSPSRN
ncbi:hypothetical protein PUN28_010972 [Cardiocondyla obscurior]|uniref:Uncharacterized protein n=1 Tax=Cardiocondyla obscurior TaxID=286306 RepID=A0AAW2FL34_9HYME